MVAPGATGAVVLVVGAETVFDELLQAAAEHATITTRMASLVLTVVSLACSVGSDTTKRVPDSVVASTHARPPIAAVSSRTIARPRPVPTDRPGVSRTV